MLVVTAVQDARSPYPTEQESSLNTVDGMNIGSLPAIIPAYTRALAYAFNAAFEIVVQNILDLSAFGCSRRVFEARVSLSAMC